MASPYYSPSGAPASSSQGSSATIRSEFQLIETALDKMPTLTADYIVVVNAGGTALIPTNNLTIPNNLIADGDKITTDSISDTNTKLGVSAGASIVSGAIQNTAFGNEALNSITTGDNCTAFGFRALKENTANSCTAVGSFSLDVNTTGDRNTALGVNTLGANITGDDNTAIGKDALTVNTASDNTAVGSSSMFSNTVGVKNTAIGFESLYTNISGDNSTALGYRALYLNTGNNNTGIGQSVLGANTSGVNNTGIGEAALGFNASSSNSTATGYHALLNSIGADNTGIGSLAGDTITTGSGNIMVGKSSDVSAAGAVGQFVIGVSVACDQDNQITIGNSSGTIKNEFDTDNAWTQSSDVRKKQNIENSELGLDFINALRPVTYQWKPANEWPKEWGIDPESKIDTDTIMTGLIAQEVEDALKQSNTGTRFAGWSDGKEGQRISKEMFIFPLINSVKSLKYQLDGQKQINDLLIDTIGKLIKRVETLEK